MAPSGKYSEYLALRIAAKFSIGKVDTIRILKGELGDAESPLIRRLHVVPLAAWLPNRQAGANRHGNPGNRRRIGVEYGHERHCPGVIQRTRQEAMLRTALATAGRREHSKHKNESS